MIADTIRRNVEPDIYQTERMKQTRMDNLKDLPFWLQSVLTGAPIAANMQIQVSSEVQSGLCQQFKIPSDILIGQNSPNEVSSEKEKKWSVCGRYLLRNRWRRNGPTTFRWEKGTGQSDQMALSDILERRWLALKPKKSYSWEQKTGALLLPQANTIGCRIFKRVLETQYFLCT